MDSLKVFKFDVPPSTYGWMLPKFDNGKLDEMASQGLYPTLDLLIIPSIGYCILFGVIRLVLTASVFKPLAKFAMKLKLKSVIPNPAIDAQLVNKKNKVYSEEEISKISKISNVPSSEVKSYIASKKANKLYNNKITKFVEALWRFLFYSYFNYLSIRFLFFPSVADFVIDTTLNFKGWPYQTITDLNMFIYQIQFGSYLHQLMWTEVTRSDAAEMIIHHIVTLSLMFLSHISKLHVIGATTLFVHDIADVLLESAKCCNYASKAKGQKFFSTISDILFGCFAITFFVSRLYFFPKLCIYSLMFEAPTILGGPFPVYYILCTLFVVLLSLHIFWSYLIVKMIIRLFTTGIEKDERSDDEEEIEDPSSPRPDKKDS